MHKRRSYSQEERATFGVEVTPEQNDIVFLAVPVAVDMMADEGCTNTEYVTIAW
jgi:hypothetical protein